MKVGIFYFSLKPGKSRQWILINGGEGYIRVEVVSASLSDALDMAKPQPDESVMNTHVVAP